MKKLVEQTDTLGMSRQKNAAAMMAAPVASLEKKTPYAIGADVSRAMADYMDFAEKKKTGKIGTFDEYERQEDMLDPRSHVANEILKLFGSAKSAAAMAEYVKTYCRAAEMEDPAGGLFGAARTREEIWKDAAKTVEEKTSAENEKTARLATAAENELKGDTVRVSGTMATDVTGASARSVAEREHASTDLQDASAQNATRYSVAPIGRLPTAVDADAAQRLEKLAHIVSNNGPISPIGFLRALSSALGCGFQK